jgi:ABC-2 type transport system permease protein
VAVLVPFVFSCLLASAALALSPGLGLRGEDWMRMAALMVVFALYLTVFAAFGLFVSALTHRRMTAFLGLLGIWTVWVFIVPNLAVDAVSRLAPAQSIYDLQKQADVALWETRTKVRAEKQDYFQRNPVKDWNALRWDYNPLAAYRSSLVSKAQLLAIQDDLYRINLRWGTEYRSRLWDLQTERRNEMRRQQRMAMLLSAISPFGAVSFASMDLARTGFVQQERIEDALNAYLISLSQYVQDKTRTLARSPVNLTDFSWFTYRDNEALGESLSRNAFHILNLVLLAVLGFAGAYVAILRYDVR